MTQYGQQVLFLSDLVRKFCLKQGNVKQVNFLRQMEFAAWAWKELFRKSIWEVKTVVLTVDPHKHTIQLPDDCERMVNISVLDRFNKLQPLTYNPHLSTVDMLCQKTRCSCTSCGGQDTLCEALDNLTVQQETIVVNDTEYTQVTYIRSNGCGALEKEINTFAWNPVTEEVEAVKNNVLLCTLEVNSNGCILPTRPNILALQDYCGFNAGAYNNFYANNYLGGINPYRSLIPTPYNFYGQWNWNAACRDIIHIFRSRKKNCTFVNDEQNCTTQCGGEQNEIHKVILSYQTSGAEPGQEIIVPEYSEMAVNMGMIYQQAVFNPRDRDTNGVMEAKWRKEKRRVEAYLNPVKMDDLRKLQTQQRPW